MSFEIFHERLPWQPKLPCNFHKKLHICNQNIVFNIPMKDKFLRFFFQLYPTHSRYVYDPTGMILAILYSKVPHMLHAKYQPNRHSGSGEEIV